MRLPRPFASPAVKIGALFFFIFFAVSPAYALNNPFSRKQNPISKLARGATNFWCSPLEFAVNMQKSTDRLGPGPGFMDGLAWGGLYAGLRVVSGLYDVLTFPIPIPWNYGPIMKPAYVFQSAQEA